MADKKCEHVLVVPSSEVFAHIDFTKPLNKSEQAVAAIVRLVAEKSQYIPREDAEKNTAFKQIIPYAMVRRGHRLMRYQRSKKGGETRLHSRWSLGVGGHVNPEDGPGWKAVVACLWREVLEETSLPKAAIKDHVLKGVLYDGSDEVGQVHLGVVFELILGKSVEPYPLSHEVAQYDYKSVEDLKKMDMANYETWSAILVKYLL